MLRTKKETGKSTKKKLVEVINNFLEMSSTIYLEEFPVGQLFEKEVFYRLGSYRQYGFCYEVAALSMLMLKSNETSRIVYGLGFINDSEARIGPHAWTEFKSEGIWWTIDPCWCPDTIIMPSFLHKTLTKCISIRSIKYKTFWSYEVSQKLHTLMQDKKTSHVFRELSFYRREKLKDRIYLSRFPDYFKNFDGKNLSEIYLFYIYFDKCPITRQIFRQFAIKDNRQQPSSKAIRNAERLKKEVEKARLN